ncbi:MAG: hypothetical protein RIS45_338 [Planctomycetota bacterium]|jgi:transcriptional regulator with XRE-family HTH domain
MDDVGKRLAWMRETTGLPSREIDRLAGLTENHSRAIELNIGNRAQLATIERIATALEVPAAWLAFGEGDAPSTEQLAGFGARVRETRASARAARRAAA